MAKKRLLIISDEPPIQETLSQMFASNEFRTFTQSTDVHVVFQLSLLQPDLVILVMGQSGDAGQEVLRGIREWSFVPIIVLLPAGDAMSAVEALKIGADQCLSESFVPQELRARVRALLRRVDTTVAARQQVAPVPVL